MYKTIIYVIPETITVAFTPLPGGPLVSRNLITIKSELLSPVHPAPAAPMLPQCNVFIMLQIREGKKAIIRDMHGGIKKAFVTCGIER